MKNTSDQRVVETSKVFSKPSVVYGEKCNTAVDWVARPPLLMVHNPRLATNELASELREGKLERLTVASHIPSDVEIRISGSEWKVIMLPIGWLCLFEDQLKGGLCFPIPSFVHEVLNYFRVSLVQVILNGIGILIRSLLTYLEQKIAPSVMLFRYLFPIKESYPSVWVCNIIP